MIGATSHSLCVTVPGTNMRILEHPEEVIISDEEVQEINHVLDNHTIKEPSCVQHLNLMVRIATSSDATLLIARFCVVQSAPSPQRSRSSTWISLCID